MGFTREQVLERLRRQIEAGVPIIGAGAGTGISAKFEEEGGVDLIVIYNSGRYRMAGRGSLAGMMPYGDANTIVVEMAAEVLTIVRDTPVLAGVCGTDPFRQMELFLKQIAALGFSGVQNFPTVGLIDGFFRQNLEETGMGYGPEVEMIRTAHRLGLLTTPYAFNPQEAARMAGAGADVVVAHMGLTTKGSIGASTALTLEESVGQVQAICDAARGVNPEVIVLCHGGPIAMPEDAEYVLQRTRGVNGFYGASSMERLPVETAIVEHMKKFKAVRF
ncbi:MAG: phosphoenolpyruvate hydrolase family protein [Candidatus Latescibacteria bacterium]|nr:phosphoenolpyruvate hydrolase family protein [Candidatus Latescibacterota bacterium]